MRKNVCVVVTNIVALFRLVICRSETQNFVFLFKVVIFTALELLFVSVNKSLSVKIMNKNDHRLT